MEILIDSNLCSGCRVCELACSFHHRGAFAPDDSSVQIVNDYLQGETQISVDSTCDLCKGEEQAVCVKYCLEGALKVGRDHGKA